MKKGVLALVAALAVVLAMSADAEPLRGLDWRLPEKWARMEGSTLVVDVPPDAGRPMVCATARVDVSRAFREFGVAILGVRFRATGVTEPDARWNGVKVMYSYVDADGATQYVGIDSLKGTFDWRFDTVRLSALANPRGIRDNCLTFFLGLQGCTGHAEFDLDSVDLTIEPSGLKPVNQDYVVRYPDPQMTTAAEAANDDLHSAQNDDPRFAQNDDPRFAQNNGHCGEAASSLPTKSAPSLPTKSASSLRGGAAPVIVAAKRPLRGCMLPERPTTEDDIATLASWGATLARFQIMRNWTAVDDCQDLEEYAQWIDSRLDNLEDVLRWAQARGMKIVVDLHSPPGGKRQRPREMNMLHDDRYADAFVETWRHIATRCAAAVQTACAPAVQTACAPAAQTACAPAVQTACAPAVQTACAPAVQTACAPAAQTACAPAVQTASAPAVQTASAPAVQTAGPLYGYDLINEPAQWGAARNNYWELQRRAAEAIREIDPATPIIVASNMADSPGAFRYLSPLAMDNVIYQIHLYAPGRFTHQGVGGGMERKADGSQYKWPDPEMGWDIDYLRRILEPVRAFQKRHHARIYVGEFSAIAWAPGADQYLRDCISLFEEYGWDWTYHAFREWGAWSVEHECPAPGKPFAPSSDNPRKRALLDGFKR